MDLCGITDVRRRLIGNLSKGYRQRVALADALIHKPPLLILDEPTTGLDIEAREGLWKAIRSLTQAGTGVLLTTHYLEEAQALASRVAVLAMRTILPMVMKPWIMPG